MNQAMKANRIRGLAKSDRSRGSVIHSLGMAMSGSTRGMIIGVVMALISKELNRIVLTWQYTHRLGFRAPRVHSATALFIAIVGVVSNTASFLPLNADELRLPLVGGWEQPEGEDTFWQIAVSGNYAYLFASHGSRVQVMNISDPAQPKPTTEFHTGHDFGNAGTVLVSGNHIFWAIGGMVKILDISDPMHLHFVGEYAYPDFWPGGFAVSGHYVLIPVGERGLEIVDVTDPTLPHLVSTFRPGRPVSYVSVSGTLAFLGLKGEFPDEYCQVVDIARVEEPKGLGLYGPIESGNWADGKAYPMSDRKVCFLSASGDSFLSLRVIDCRDPANPRLSAGPTYVWADDWFPWMSVSDDYGYVYDRSPHAGGVYVYDLLHPHIRRVAAYEDAVVRDLIVRGDNAFFVGARSLGGPPFLGILDLKSVLARPRIIPSEVGPTIRWEKGTLQFTPSLNGPWTDLPAASPIPLSPIGEKGFFRVKVEP